MIVYRRHYQRWILFIAVLLLMTAGVWWLRPRRAPRRAGGAAPELRGRALPARGARAVAAADALQLVRAAVRLEQGAVLNVARWGPLADDTPVLVVQAGREERALRRLLAGLARVRRLHTALLVVSHDHYDDRINALVRSVRFCRVMQLFYPHSLQLHPARFPGPDPRDCGAPGADPADCAARDARRTQRKQHWWWKANYVFERLAPVGARHPVLFLEARHEVAPDLLLVLRLAARALARVPAAHVLALGRAPPPPAARAAPPALLTVDEWRPAYAPGLAFNRSVWKKISSLAMHYCMYDDSSWSRSLANVFAQFPAGRVLMVASVAPRVLPQRGAEPARWPGAAPRRLRVERPWPARRAAGGRAPAPAGGWADLRDQLFCVDPLLQLADDDYRDTYGDLGETTSLSAASVTPSNLTNSRYAR